MAIMRVSPEIAPGFTTVRVGAIYIIELAALTFIYFWLVKLGLALASINPSASPVWPATGFAMAILLLRGYRVWPAIFVGAFLANVSSAGSIYTSAAIAIGNSLEGVVSALLINRWSGGVRTFRAPAGIVKFALISTAATAISPAIGVSSLSFGGYAEWARFGPIFMTWWLGDLAGALVVAPALVLWAANPLARAHTGETIAIFVVAASIGLIAFSPMIEQTVNRTPLAFLAVAPLVWTALRRDTRDTATAALILAGFAVWGTSVGGGPFSWAGFNESFVLLVMFIVTAAIPSLMLSAMAAELQVSHATLERKVEERTHQLELANLAKTRFLAVASHDLRQPLHALGLLIGQLDLRTNRAERGRIIARVGTAVSNLEELLNALLDISKLDAGAVSPDIRSFPIEPMLRNIETLSFATAREKSLRLRVLISDVWVRSDCVLLERILLNLVSNAIRYTERGGIIVGCRRRSDSVRIEVWDTGIGIPHDQQESIFREFYRVGGAETGGAGLGLGLAIVERLCRLLKHPLKLTSICGKGSRFSLTVPLAPAQSEPSAASDLLLGLARPFADRFVLIIDDNKLALDGLGGLLRGWGCHVSAFSSAAAAKASLMERCWAPDLIICDYHLSKGENGAKVIPDLRRTLNAPIPALLVTADISPERNQEAKTDGYDLLQKPAPPMILRAKLQRVWKQEAAIAMSATSERKPSTSSLV